MFVATAWRYLHFTAVGIELDKDYDIPSDNLSGKGMRFQTTESQSHQKTVNAPDGWSISETWLAPRHYLAVCSRVIASSPPLLYHIPHGGVNRDAPRNILKKRLRRLVSAQKADPSNRLSRTLPYHF
jgi:hypothetical protein